MHPSILFLFWNCLSSKITVNFSMSFHRIINREYQWFSISPFFLCCIYKDLSCYRSISPCYSWLQHNHEIPQHIFPLVPSAYFLVTYSFWALCLFIVYSLGWFGGFSSPSLFHSFGLVRHHMHHQHSDIL